MQESDEIPRLDLEDTRVYLKLFPRVLISYDISHIKTRGEIIRIILKYAVGNAVIDETSSESAYTIFIENRRFISLRRELYNAINNTKFPFYGRRKKNPDRLIVTPVASVYENLDQKYWYQYYIAYSLRKQYYLWMRL